MYLLASWKRVRNYVRLLLTVTMLTFLTAGVSGKTEKNSPDGNISNKEDIRLVWQEDYVQAIEIARRNQKMLFIHFYNPSKPFEHENLVRNALPDNELKQKIHEFVFLKLPTDYQLESEQPITLLEHEAFREMRSQPGIAIIDMANREAPYYHYVVSAFPFGEGIHYGPKAIQVILNLPKGTITQRTMVYAIRMHPESPKSTTGQIYPLLVTEATSHSTHQASIRLQGHHNWENRFHRITGQLPDGLIAQEVCAESWPGKTLVAACIDCVDSWRQSSGHWSAVKRYSPYYGYDIKRGDNGIWYATGIFGYPGD